MVSHSGFYLQGRYYFLCIGSESSIAFITSLEGDKDSVMHYSDEGIVYSESSVKSYFTTKSYRLGGRSNLKKVDSIYLTVSSKGRMKIKVNNMRDNEINLGFASMDYNVSGFKSLKLMPNLQVEDTVFLRVSANEPMSVKEIEIFYKTVG